MTERHAFLAKPEYETLRDMLLVQSRRRPEQRVCTVLDSRGEERASITYAELDRRARATALVLQQATVPGQRALVMCPTGLDFVVAFYACAYAGLVAIPVPSSDTVTGGHSTRSRLSGIIKDADPAVVLTTTEITDLPMIPELAGVETIVVGDVPLDLAELWRGESIDSASPAFLQYTSGSTSDPKGAVLTHGAVLANISAAAFAVRAGECAPEDFQIVSWLPLFHDMGLAQVLTAVFVGGHLALLSPTAFLLRPVVWLEAISRYRGYVASAPNFAYDLCAEKVTVEQRARLDLSSWRIALNGAEPIRHQSIEDFTAAFADAGFSPDSFMPCYGLAEATVYVSGQRRPDDRRYLDLDAAALEQHARLEPPVDGEPSRRIVACGRTPANLDVRIIDPVTLRPVAPDSVGEVWIAGEGLADGYWQQPEVSAAKFGGQLPEAAGASYLRTGDLGFFRENQLFVLGRMDDVIIIDGRNHYPQDIEGTISRCHPAIASNLVAAFAYRDGDAQRVGVVAETARRVRVVTGDAERRSNDIREDELATAIRRHVADEHQVRVDAVVLIKPGGLPRTTSGKIQRGRSRDLLVSGEHKSW